MCTRVLNCSTVFAPPTKVEQIRIRVQDGCKSAPGCIFIKHRLHDQITSQVQIYTAGVYLHRGVYCAYERSFSVANISFNAIRENRILAKNFRVYSTLCLSSCGIILIGMKVQLALL